MSEFDRVLSERRSLAIVLEQARRVLRSIRDDAETLEESKILAQSIVGKKEQPLKE